MCSIFGALQYDKGVMLKHKYFKELINALALCAEVRGTDATGISYVENNKVVTFKLPQAAHEIDLDFPENTRTVMGHTRMATHGSEKHNYNNHPFNGECGNTSFALAHNGVLYGYENLRKKFNIPNTHIETDSYIAVQLLERYDKLDMENVKLMSEAISGSFMITVLREDGTLFLTKGSNPITIYHFPSLSMYVYASTKEILDNALTLIGFDSIEHETIAMTEEEIFEIHPDGTIAKGEFTEDVSCYRSYSKYYSYGGYYSDYDYGWGSCDTECNYDYGSDTSTERGWIYEYANMYGISDDDIDTLITYGGYTADDIQDMFYDKGYFHSSLATAKQLKKEIMAVSSLT